MPDRPISGLYWQVGSSYLSPSTYMVGICPHFHINFSNLPHFFKLNWFCIDTLLCKICLYGISDIADLGGHLGPPTPTLQYFLGVLDSSVLHIFSCIWYCGFRGAALVTYSYGGAHSKHLFWNFPAASPWGFNWWLGLWPILNDIIEREF